METPSTFSTPKQLAEKFPFFTEAAIRWHIFRAEQNGLAPAIRRIGRKILIRDDLFLQWVEDQKTA